MSVTNIKKINVRSPYYVVVKGTETEDVTPTETTVTEETFKCGGSKSIGAFVGKKKFNITATDRDNGTYTVSFSGVKFPIKYRIGLASNIDNVSFTTKGLDTYATEWSNAGETAGDLDAAGSYPNGLSFDATYTSTSEDPIMLEVYHPVISTTDYSFSLTCPDIKSAPALDAGDFVTVVTVVSATASSNIVGLSFPLKINGVSQGNAYNSLGTAHLYRKGDTRRMVASGATLVASSQANRFLNFNNTTVTSNFIYGSFFKHAQHYDSDSLLTEPSVSARALPLNAFTSDTNVIEIETPNNLGGSSEWPFYVIITRHPVIDVLGTKYIQGNDAVDIKGIMTGATLYGAGATLQITYTGGPDAELVAGEAIAESPILEEAGESPFMFPLIRPVTFKRF